MSEKSNCLLAESHLKTHMDASFYPVVKNLRDAMDELDEVRKEVKKHDSSHKFDRVERSVEKIVDSCCDAVNANLTTGFDSTKHKVHDLKELTEDLGVNATACCEATQAALANLLTTINALGVNVTNGFSNTQLDIGALSSVIGDQFTALNTRLDTLDETIAGLPAAIIDALGLGG